MSSKTTQEACWIYTFENIPRIFKFFTLPLEIPIMLHPSEIWRPKTNNPGISRYFFSIPPGNSTFFESTPGNSTCYFFNTPGFFDQLILQVIPKIYVKRLNCFQEIDEHHKSNDV